LSGVDLELMGKRAIVTGGSRGIGRAIARQLALEGGDVVIAARTEAPLKESAAALADETGRRIEPVVADTTDDQSVTDLVSSAVDRLGGVDILVNNAAYPGGLSGTTPAAEVEKPLIVEDFNTKVLGYLRTAQAVAPYMTSQGWGRIINIGGLSARQTGLLSASIRNASVSVLTKTLADQLGPRGINVVALHPGGTRTEANEGQDLSGLARRATIGRVVDASEIAWIVAFLASPKSVAINGDTIACGGGSPGSIYY
jgi:NAD(P)-dependent dehydrogenase (short-subunit alcohol dehydrogenase family)